MKGKISNKRTPIIFTSVTGKVYENGSMPKIAKVVKEEPKVIVKNNVVKTESQKNAIQLIMEEKFPNLHRDTIKGIFETYPNFPTEIKDQIIMQGYAVEDVFTVIENYLNIDKKPIIQIDESLFSDIPATNPVEPFPNQDNTNKNTKSSDKKLVWAGVALGLLVLIFINN
jgi:hypothetical protein